MKYKVVTITHKYTRHSISFPLAEEFGNKYNAKNAGLVWAKLIGNACNDLGCSKSEIEVNIKEVEQIEETIEELKENETEFEGEYWDDGGDTVGKCNKCGYIVQVSNFCSNCGRKRVDR